MSGVGSLCRQQLPLSIVVIDKDSRPPRVASPPHATHPKAGWLSATANAAALRGARDWHRREAGARASEPLPAARQPAARFRAVAARAARRPWAAAAVAR